MYENFRDRFAFNLRNLIVYRARIKFFASVFFEFLPFEEMKKVHKKTL